VIIDGNPDGMSKKIKNMNMDRENARLSLLKKKDNRIELYRNNPYAMGQFMNHSVEKANTLVYEYNFHPYFPLELRCLIPNLTFSKREDNFSIPTILFIAKRTVENEELFFNYRYNPNNQHPQWY